MSASETIGVEWDANSMFEMLRFAFARHDSVVMELLQNSRRAGATCVEIEYDEAAKRLVVRDDGCGLEDFSELVHLCSSGWDQKTKDLEKPYGIGFMATFYAGSVVSFSSREKRVTIRSAELLGGGNERFSLEESGVVAGAEVELQGFDWKDSSTRMRSMVEGFPVKVIFNGEEMQRPDSMSDAFAKVDVGNVRFTDAVPMLPKRGSTTVYLQGFCVHKSRTTPASAVVHLDSEKFRGKFPDRDRLIDEEVVLLAVEQCLWDALVADLRQAAKSMEALEFCRSRYEQANSLGELSIFDDIEVVPGDWFWELTSLPYEARVWEDGGKSIGIKGYAAVTRKDVESGAIRVAVLDSLGCDDEEGAARWNLAHAAGLAVLAKDLGEGHWLRSIASLSDDSKVIVEVVGAVQSSMVQMRGHTYLDIIPCESVVYRCEDVSATAAVSVFVGNGDIAVPRGAEIEVYALRQASSYCDEWDVFQEDEFDADASLFRQKCDEAMEPDSKKRLAMQVKAALEEIRCDAIGFQLVVTVGPAGMVVEPLQAAS